MDTSLVVLAAGIGSRYGAGIKQLAKMDDNGYTIIDYSIYDAIKAGFNKVVFIIRRDIEKDFKEIIGSRIEKIIDVEYAYQEMDLDFLKENVNRKKPWGTVHASLAVKGIVNEPFLIINADDYYGKEVFKSLHDFLIDSDNEKKSKLQIAMAGYKLKNTLSENGTVTRGVSVVDKDNNLVDIIETHEIGLDEDGKLKSKEKLKEGMLNMDAYVSMNLWASYPEFLDLSDKYFKKYISDNKDKLETCEYVLPNMIGEMIEDEKANVKLLPTNDTWIGITYKEDLEIAQKSFKKMLEDKVYPADIWKKE